MVDIMKEAESLLILYTGKTFGEYESKEAIVKAIQDTRMITFEKQDMKATVTLSNAYGYFTGNLN